MREAYSSKALSVSIAFMLATSITSLGTMAHATPDGLDMNSLQALKQNADATRKERPNTAPPPLEPTRAYVAPSSLPPKQTEPSRIEKQDTAALPDLLILPAPEEVEQRVLNTSCAPYMSLAPASAGTASFLLDAPCLANKTVMALFGTNPGMWFRLDEYGRAQFVFSTSSPDLYPIYLMEPKRDLETVSRFYPDGPISLYDFLY